MIVLELFAGSRSIGKICDKMKIRCISLDNEPFENIDIVVDILEWDYKNSGIKPNFIWASPVCTKLCRPGARWHYQGKKPITEEAIKGIKLVERTIEIILFFKPKFFCIENPVGKFRKQKALNALIAEYPNLKRDLVTCCQYGDTQRKPTDLINNIDAFKGKSCSAKGKCHAKSNEKGSSQYKSGSYERSKIPENLCEEIIKSIYYDLDKR